MTKYTKYPSAFTNDDLKVKLSSLTPFTPYSFTKRNNLYEFNSQLLLLPNGYVNKLKSNIELIDTIYSGSSESPLLLTVIVGRNDTFSGKECFDIDVFNIAPDTKGAESYFSQQWHHFKDENGNRTSYEINPFIISDEEKRKDVTYSQFLTGSSTYSSFEEYEKNKPDFMAIHRKSFGDLKF